MASQQASGASADDSKPRPPPQSAFEVDSVELAKKRQGYYDNWRNLTKEELERAKAEEAEEKRKAAEDLGLESDTPRSEAERIDREKRAALREAKKQWDGKKAQEEEMKFTFKDQTNVVKVLKAVDVLHRPVLVVANCKDCRVTLSPELGSLIKVFVENCENTEVVLQCPLITQHIEVSHSDKMTLVVAIPTQTIQIDLVDGMIVRYEKDTLLEGHRLYHAGVKKLKVHHYDDQSVAHDYTDLEASPDDNVPLEERQFVTHLKNGLLVTERVRRASGMMPMTDDELAKVAGTEEIETAHLRQARDKKIAGTEAFKSAEYMQAGVFYTQAMQLAPNDKEMLCVCLANRAACNLKLGRLEEALDDSVACLAIDDKYAKGWFRKGIALHALKQYGPAIESLSRADALEPKNKQIQEAIGFAKVLLQKQLKEQADKYAS